MKTPSATTKILLHWSSLGWNLLWTFLVGSLATHWLHGLSHFAENMLVIVLGIGWIASLVPLYWAHRYHRGISISILHHLPIALLAVALAWEAFVGLILLSWINSPGLETL